MVFFGATKGRARKLFEVKEEEAKVEKAFLVGIRREGMSDEDVSNNLDELTLLVENLAIPIVGRIMCPLREPQPHFLLGTGKAEEINKIVTELQADCIIFDDEISPSQQRNWEKLTNILVIDRQEVILDIFSQRAQTREAKLQISLSRAKYNLPRLKRAWTHLSRQRSGVNQKGEGEKQIELDRRMTNERIKKLEAELEIVRKQRNNQRKRRQKLPIPNAAIVGYTNAGKSSLLNFMTNAHVYVADKLFATLDPTTKPIILPNKQKLLLTDTIGFVKKLPHQLVESFKATLEESVIADFLVHVIDINSSHLEEQYQTTLGVLEEIGAQTKRVITVFNKIDLIHDPFLISCVSKKYPDAIFVSSKTGLGIETLKERMADELNSILSITTLKIPIDRYDIVALIHRTCDIQEEICGDDSVTITANVVPSIKKEISPFVV